MKTRNLSTPSPSTSAAGLVSVSEDALPGRIEVKREFGALAIQWRWRQWKQVILLGGFCAIWDSVVVWAMLFADLPLLFIITHGGSGLFVTYALAANFFNKTRLEVTHNHLTIAVRPLWWRRKIEIPTNDLKQLYVKEVVGQTDPDVSNSKGTLHYYLVAQRRSGGEVILMKELQTPEQARAIESLIEDHLRIENVAVDGEYGR